MKCKCNIYAAEPLLIILIQYNLLVTFGLAFIDECSMLQEESFLKLYTIILPLLESEIKANSSSGSTTMSFKKL